MKICAMPKPHKPHAGLECCRKQGHPGMHMDWINVAHGAQRVSWFAPDHLITAHTTGEAAA